MPQVEHHLAPRACFLPPIPELDCAADLLSVAADCLLSGNVELARERVGEADIPAVFAYAARIMGREDFEIHRRRPVDVLPLAAAKAEARMPSSAVAKSIYARDGWRCRFCGCRIVLKEARNVMRAWLPGAILWGETKGVYHAAFYALTAVPDHVVPHAHGGGNDPDNLVTACWPCNFGRNSWSLEQVGILDPRLRPAVADSWDGLSRLTCLALPRKEKSTEMSAPNVTKKHAGRGCMVKEHNAEAWIAAINRFGPETSDLVQAFVARCSDFGVSCSIKKFMVVTMRVDGVTIEPFGFELNGDVSIPWGLNGKKEQFKHFAHVIADAIPDGEALERPKQWVVKRHGRKIQVREFLDASDAIYTALEGLQAALRGI